MFSGRPDGDVVVGSLDLIEFLTLYGSEFLDSDGDGLCDERTIVLECMTNVECAQAQDRFTFVDAKSAQAFNPVVIL